MNIRVLLTPEKVQYLHISWENVVPTDQGQGENHKKTSPSEMEHKQKLQFFIINPTI
jgi:hypothetical protein